MAILGDFEPPAHHADIRFDSHGLNRASVGRVVERGGELEALAVAQRHDLLHRALAETLGAHDHGAALILKGAGHDFGSRGATPIDQYHQGDIRRCGFPVGREAHLGIFQAPFGIDHQPLFKEGVGDGDGSLQNAAGVIAQVENQSL